MCWLGLGWLGGGFPHFGKFASSSSSSRREKMVGLLCLTDVDIGEKGACVERYMRM